MATTLQVQCERHSRARGRRNQKHPRESSSDSVIRGHPARLLRIVRSEARSSASLFAPAFPSPAKWEEVPAGRMRGFGFGLRCALRPPGASEKPQGNRAATQGSLEVQRSPETGDSIIAAHNLPAQWQRAQAKIIRCRSLRLLGYPREGRGSSALVRNQRCGRFAAWRKFEGHVELLDEEPGRGFSKQFKCGLASHLCGHAGIA